MEQVASDFPVLVYVLDGDIEAAANGTDETTPLTAGNAGVFSNGVSVSAGAGAHVLVAVIGPEVPSAPVAEAIVPTEAGTPAEVSTPTEVDTAATTGQIVVLSELCPPGVTVEQALDTSGADPCFGGGPVEGMRVTAIGNEGTSFQATIGANGMAILTDLPEDYYQVIFANPDGLGPTVGVCGGQDSSSDLPVVTMSASSVELELPADKEYLCVTRTLQPADPGDTVDGTPVD